MTRALSMLLVAICLFVLVPAVLADDCYTCAADDCMYVPPEWYGAMQDPSYLWTQCHSWTYWGNTYCSLSGMQCGIEPSSADPVRSYLAKSRTLEQFLDNFPGVTVNDMDAIQQKINIATKEKAPGDAAHIRYEILRAEASRRTGRALPDGAVFALPISTHLKFRNQRVNAIP